MEFHSFTLHNLKYFLSLWSLLGTCDGSCSWIVGEFDLYMSTNTVLRFDRNYSTVLIRLVGLDTVASYLILYHCRSTTVVLER